jgi:tetratricopeptide (TPR) repeat protein
VIAYSTGIQQHPSHLQLHLLLLNRSQTFIKLERFSFALADAEHALSLIESIPTSSTSSSSNGIDPLSPTLSAADVIALKEKALSRKAKALYSLRRWQLALEVYRQLLSISPHLSDAQTGISSCQSRLSEASGGSCFDFPSLYRLSLQQHHSKEGGTAKMGDVADYVGPVKVAPIEGKGGGRGLVATREIQPGEILLAVRAPALVSQSEIPKRLSPRLVSLNLEEDVLDETHLPLYIHNLIYRLLDQPELIPKINDLYTGPRSSCTSPTFDLYTPDHPSSSFASSNPNLSTPPSSSSLPPIRPSDLYRAAFYNASTPSCSLPIDSLSSDAIEYYEEAPGALFSESAMINSECRRNCIQSVCFPLSPHVHIYLALF